MTELATRWQAAATHHHVQAGSATDALVARLAIAERERDALRRDLTEAHAAMARLDALVDAAVAETVEARHRADVELEAAHEQFRDGQTEWELKLTEMEKQVHELAAELDAQREVAGDDVLEEVRELREQVQRLRDELDRARAETDTAWAESDAAFAELAEAHEALSAAHAPLAELEHHPHRDEPAIADAPRDEFDDGFDWDSVLDAGLAFADGARSNDGYSAVTTSYFSAARRNV